MIAFNFDYYKPASINEAVNLFEDLNRKKLEPIYYSGGTEIITMARKNDLFTRAVIDIKEIPECRVYGLNNNEFIIGASIALSHVSESKAFPLISKISTFPSDHTARNKITFCGNICGKIIYKEAILGLLITDSKVVIAGKNGRKVIPINEAFNQKLQLNKGEFLLQTRTEKEYASLPYIALRRTKQGKTGYPLISIAALKKDNRIRTAFSGVCAFPFRSTEMEEYLNNKSIPLDLRIKEATNHLPAPILNNIQGSADYRKFVLQNMLAEALTMLEGERK